MSIQLNHTIVHSHDKAASAAFMTELLGLPAPKPLGPFLVVEAENGVSLDFMEAKGEVAAQHYAFLVSETEFDEIFHRIEARALPYWADPARRQANQINTRDGGRGFYFEGPSGHFLEVLTRPYGSGTPS